MRWAVMSLGLAGVLINLGCASSRCCCRWEEPQCTAAVVEDVTVVEALPERVSAPAVTQPVSDEAYGHAPNYRWLVGRLQRVHMPEGEWKIRYAPLDVEDRWGGSMVLAVDQRLAQFQEGDAVYIEGQIIVNRPSLYVAGPLYRIGSIQPFTRQLASRVAD